MRCRIGRECWKKWSAATGHNGSPLPRCPKDRSRPTLARVHQLQIPLHELSPKNIQVSAPKARYGPNGNFADQTRFPMSNVARPTIEPATEPAKMLNKTPR